MVERHHPIFWDLRRNRISQEQKTTIDINEKPFENKVARVEIPKERLI